MISALQKILGRSITSVVNADPDSSSFVLGDIAHEYRDAVEFCMESLRIPPSHVKIDVREMGTTREGHPIFHVFVRLARWDESVSPRILTAIPELERRARKVVNGASMLGHHSHFGGLWFHVSGRAASAASAAGANSQPAGLDTDSSAPSQPGELAAA